MSNITRWNPISEFDDLMNRYNRMFGLARNEREGKDLFSRSDWAPAVDIKETADAFTVEAELPGMNKDDVKVTVHDGVLTIQGERKSEEETKDKKLHRIERFYGSFMRRFTLPDNVDENSVKANFKDGMLTLTLQKAEPKEPKAVEVEVQQPPGSVVTQLVDHGCGLRPHPTPYIKRFCRLLHQHAQAIKHPSSAVVVRPLVEGGGLQGIHHVVHHRIARQNRRRHRRQVTLKAGAGAVDHQIKRSGRLFETAGREFGITGLTGKQAYQRLGLGHGAVGDGQAGGGFRQDWPQHPPYRTTGTQYQDTQAVEVHAEVAGKIPDQANAVGVVGHQGIVGIQVQGVSRAGFFCPRCAMFGLGPGLFLERYGHIQAFAASFEEVPDGAGEIVHRRLDGGVFHRLTGLAGKQAVNTGGFAVGDGVAHHRIEFVSHRFAPASSVRSGNNPSAVPLRCSAPAGGCSPSAPAAAVTSGSTRCARQTATRTGCPGRTPG